jgi:hypothetical protein
MNPSVGQFREIWIVDFEFTAPAGERPRAICMVAHELRSGGSFALSADEFRDQSEPPIPHHPDVLVVAYYASAEMGCYLALGWPLPHYVLDLYAEFRCLTSGQSVPCGHGLLGALAYYGLGSGDAVEKDSMRQLAMRGGPYTEEETAALIQYCKSDVQATARLTLKMLPDIDLERAVLRGRFMKAAARIEWAGVPIDIETLERLRASWAHIKDQLISEVDRQFGVFEGQSFRTDRFAGYLRTHGIAWPRIASGALDLSDDAFKQMSKIHSGIAPLRELRHALSQLRLQDLAVGSDGRNRCLLSAFRSKTGRNQPSNAKFIFGPSVWLRSLIKPEAGRALAYIDYEQQEFGIAAALSGDAKMIEAYQSGDPYLTFAKQARAVPADATKASHPDIREQFKVCALAVQYGMGEQSLALKLNQSTATARRLLELHHDTYPRFWNWVESARDHAMLRGSLHSVFGWLVHVGQLANPRSLMNFPMQANGAEILRLACCLLTEAGITVCAPVHDAVLVEADESQIEDVVTETQSLMQMAGEIILDGFKLRTDVEIVRYPDRYFDKRGTEIWHTVMQILHSHLRDPADPRPRSGVVASAGSRTRSVFVSKGCS